MNSSFFRVSFLVALLCGCASVSNEERVLDQLSGMMSEAKNSEKIYFVQCPENVGSLVGESKATVVSKLGVAPYIENNLEIYSFVKDLDESKVGVFAGKDGIDHVVLPPHGGWTNLELTYDGDHIVSAHCQDQRP